MEDQRIELLAKAWIESSKEEDRGLVLFDECHEEPEIAWRTILKIIETELEGEQTALLAAGPMEDLLSFHGLDFIDRVEHEAKNNPRLNDLLGGVWQCSMTDDVWARVQAVRKAVW